MAHIGVISIVSGTQPRDLTFYDDITGAKVETDLVITARAEEMAEFRKHGVYKLVKLEECLRVTGKPPVGVRWVDINKGDDVNPEYRSRLVAQELKRDRSLELFAATPPLEALKLLLSRAVTDVVGYRKGQCKRSMKMDFIDVRRAYFHARSKRRVFIKFPTADAQEGYCGELARSMYGTRDAAQKWEAKYAEFLTK